jgi:Fe-S-cluster containining protein
MEKLSLRRLAPSSYDVAKGEDMGEYECDGCGACCSGAFPIFVSKMDADREPRIAAGTVLLPRSLAQPGWSRQLYPLPFLEACGFLDEAKRCTIYATRPQVCQDFPAGGNQCQQARQKMGIAPLAPRMQTALSGVE